MIQVIIQLCHISELFEHISTINPFLPQTRLSLLQYNHGLLKPPLPGFLCMPLPVLVLMVRSSRFFVFSRRCQQVRTMWKTTLWFQNSSNKKYVFRIRDRGLIVKSFVCMYCEATVRNHIFLCVRLIWKGCQCVPNVRKTTKRNENQSSNNSDFW